MAVMDIHGCLICRIHTRTSRYVNVKQPAVFNVHSGIIHAPFGDSDILFIGRRQY